MKKRLLAVGVVAIMLLFTGCMDLTISCGVDKERNAYLQYDIRVDISAVDPGQRSSVRTALNSVSEHYRQLGFTVNTTEQENKITFAFMLRRKAASYPEAYNTLKEMLRDPALSPFTRVDMVSDAAPHEMAFSFSAEADLSVVLSSAHSEELPRDIRDQFTAGIDNSNMVLNVSFPASEVLSSYGQLHQEEYIYSVSKPLDTAAPTSLEITGRLGLDNGVAVEENDAAHIISLQSTADAYRALQYIAMSLLGITVIATPIVIIRMRKKNKQG